MDRGTPSRTSVLAAAACAPLVVLPPIADAQRATPEDLAVRGVAVSWPIAANSTPVAPGSKLRVTFERRGPGRPRSVDVRVVRLSKSGRKLHTLRHQRLRRSGKVVVQLPSKVGRRYAVTVRSGKIRSRTLVRTQLPALLPQPAPAPAPIVPVVATPPVQVPFSDGSAPPAPTSERAPAIAPPAAPAPPEPTCNLREELLDFRPPTAVLHIATTPARPGETRAYEVENTSPRCVYGGPSYRWERFEGERWGIERWYTVPNSPFVLFAPPNVGLPPGKRWSGTASVPNNAAPGLYRLTVQWFAARTLTAQLDVTR